VKEGYAIAPGAPSLRRKMLVATVVIAVAVGIGMLMVK